MSLISFLVVHYREGPDVLQTSRLPVKRKEEMGQQSVSEVQQVQMGQQSVAGAGKLDMGQESASGVQQITFK